MKRKVYTVPAKTPYQYIQLFNGLFELTEREMEILSKFIAAQLSLDKKKVAINPFVTEIKKRIAEELEMSNFSHLNVYIKRLKDKKAISKVPGGYSINPMLLPSGEKEIVFKLK